jgi:hypothetical protein
MGLVAIGSKVTSNSTRLLSTAVEVANRHSSSHRLPNYENGAATGRALVGPGVFVPNSPRVYGTKLRQRTTDLLGLFASLQLAFWHDL